MRPFYTPHQLRHDHDDILFINEHWGEIKEAYFQVLEALKAPEGGCECTWIKKTFIPTYFYISRDSSVANVSEEEIQDFFNNLVVSYNYEYERERFSPLVKLSIDGDVYALPIPHVTGSNNLTLYAYSFIGIVDDSEYPERTTPPFYNEHPLNIYASTGVMYGNKISLTLYKNSSKGYLYLSHNNTETDPTPMTFKFLDTVKQCTTEVEDKPEETPKPPTPKPPTPETPTPKPPTPETPDYTTPVGVVEGVLTPYTLKVRFTAASWYRDPGRFSVYHAETQTWKEATKIVDDVVYFIFTEEEALNCNNDGWNEWIFAKHPPMPIQEINWENDTHETTVRSFKFNDTIMDDVVNIEDNTYLTAYVTIGSAYI